MVKNTLKDFNMCLTILGRHVLKTKYQRLLIRGICTLAYLLYLQVCVRRLLVISETTGGAL